MEGSQMIEGLRAIAPHLYTIALLWLLAIIIAQAVKWVILRGMEEAQSKDDEAVKANMERQQNVRKSVRVFNIAATAVAGVFILGCVLFLYNPTERTYEEMDRIKEATVDEDYAPSSKEEIEALNVESHDVKKSKEKKVKAHEENIEAMDESVAIFRKAAKEAEDPNASKKEERR